MALDFSLLGYLGLKTQDFEAGTRRAKAELTQMQAAAQAATAGFRNFGTQLGGLVAGVAGLGAIKSGLDSIVKTGLDMERLRGSFTAITGSVATGQQEFVFVSQTANRLGLDITSLADQYRSLSAATRGTVLEGTGTRELFTSLSTASRAYGLSTEQTGRALTALQQIIGKGKVSQEELRQQLGEVLPGSAQIAARGVGVTTQELDRMIAKGLDAIEFARVFIRQLTAEVPAATANATAGFIQLGNQIALLKDRIAQGGLLPFVNDVTTGLAGLLQKSNELDQMFQARAIGRLGDTAGAATADELRRLKDAIRLQSDLSESMEGPFGFLQTGALERSQDTIDKLVAQVRSRSRFNQLAAGDIGEELLLKAPLEQREALQKSLTKGRDILQGFRVDLDRINQEARLTPELFNKDQEALKAAQDRAKELRAVLIEMPRSQRPPELVSGLRDLERQAGSSEKALESAREGIRTSEQMAKHLAREQHQRDDYVKSLLREVDTARTLGGVIIDLTVREEQLGFVAGTAAADRVLGLKETIRSVEVARRKFNELTEAEEEANAALLQGLVDPQFRPKAFEEDEDGLVPFQGIRDDYAAMVEDLHELTEGFGNEFMDMISRITTDAKFSFKDLGLSIAADMQRALGRKFLAPLLDKALNAGISLLGSAGNPTGGNPSGIFPGTSVVSGSLPAGTATNFTLPQMAEGGYMMPNEFYRVGERGSEIIWSGSAGGTVYPHGQGPGNQIINVYISSPDAAGVQRSVGEIRYKIAQQLRGLSRDM